ncbi:hypothetical protein RHMOL_Rhmol05G0122300 [Rhododendron molle]|uniref:Uncharacterized protein n=1 Tax=Rhododendron molle TaxID=49168 RepID=A0ACC0NNH9_RHOML|nr:hypothetical protein RHMOL_Rhmol05G0122300 [Rhododendron molle]
MRLECGKFCSGRFTIKSKLFSQVYNVVFPQLQEASRETFEKVNMLLLKGFEYVKHGIQAVDEHLVTVGIFDISWTC